MEKWLVIYLRSEGRFWLGLWQLKRGEETMLVACDEDVPHLHDVSVLLPMKGERVTWTDRAEGKRVEGLSVVRERGITVNVHSSYEGALRHVFEMMALLQRHTNTLTFLGDLPSWSLETAHAIFA